MGQAALALICVGIGAGALWAAVRDPHVTWGYALRSLAGGLLMIVAGFAAAAAGACLLLAVSGGRAVDQAALLAFAVFLGTPLEAQRWLPRRDPGPWYPTRMFRVYEAGLLLVVAAIGLWGLLDPSDRGFG